MEISAADAEKLELNGFSRREGGWYARVIPDTFRHTYELLVHPSRTKIFVLKHGVSSDREQEVEDAIGQIAFRAPQAAQAFASSLRDLDEAGAFRIKDGAGTNGRKRG